MKDTEIEDLRRENERLKFALLSACAERDDACAALAEVAAMAADAAKIEGARRVSAATRLSGLVDRLEIALGSDPEPEPRPDWDTYFMSIARVVATRADCTRRQVGCVVTLHNRIMSTGYNGAPSGEDGCATAGACPRGLLTHDQVPPNTDYNAEASRCIAVHAEANALTYARGWLHGATAYVTDEPCPQCAAQLRGAGITRIVTPRSMGEHADAEDGTK